VNLTVLPVDGIGEVRPGDDLATLITDAAPWLERGDVLVVTSKVVSKAEGRLVAVPADGPGREAARLAAVAGETVRTVASRGSTQIVQTRHGFVMAAAGIDASNVDKEHLVLLPADPDASARALRTALRDRYGLDVAIVISDTMGRPWRTGLTDVALGAAGIDALRDYRGETDTYGNELSLTQMAVIDELCSAAELVKGKCDQVPVAVIRGLRAAGVPDGDGAAVLIRGADQDLFSLGTVEARADGLRTAAQLSDVERFADALVADDVLAAASAGLTQPQLLEVPVKAGLPVGTARALVPHVPAGADPASLAQAGAGIHRLRCALAAAGAASAWLTGADVDGVDLPDGRMPLGLIAIGMPAPAGPTVRSAAGRPAP
jgi:coenzyme F420-0:L-glutamate ligase/coenzyme F420-1:gamma-L-glutamate ligase